MIWFDLIIKKFKKRKLIDKLLCHCLFLLQHTSFLFSKLISLCFLIFSPCRWRHVMWVVSISFCLSCNWDIFYSKNEARTVWVKRHHFCAKLWFPVKSAPSQIGPSQIGPNSNRPQVKSASKWKSYRPKKIKIKKE